MIGLGNIMKRTSKMGHAIYKYEYIDQYLKRSSLGFLCLNLHVIYKGINVIIKDEDL